MIKIPEHLPVPKHHTMEIVDSSKIQAFQDCPRGFFFNYVLGLRSVYANVHLDFGSAWHDAMEALLLAGEYSDNAVAFAYQMFLKKYREAFPDEITDNDRAPKNPEYAWRALKMYADQYRSDRFKVLHTETAGIIPVSKDRKIVVKLDSILEDLSDGLINSMEHKTTGYNSASWRDKWVIMLQVESYTHLLYSMYPEDKVGKVIINGAVFTKSRTFDGVRVPVHKTKQQMAAYLWNVNHWIDMIEWNYEQLSKIKKEDPIMSAFPINCASCSKFGCRMDGLCATFPNPLKFVDNPPSGYEVNFWDPLRENLAQVKNVIEQDGDKLTIVKKSESRLVKELPVIETPVEKEEDFSMFMAPGDGNAKV